MATPGGFLDVSAVVQSMGIMPGQKAADLGCGSGYFTIVLAQAVGASGAVIAVDVMQEPLESVQVRADVMGLKNIRTMRADLEVLGGTKIPDASQDWTVLINVLFQSRKREAILAEAARITVSGGRVLIIDWASGAGGMGPPDDLRPTEAEVRQMAQIIGLEAERTTTTDAHHFGVVFKK